MPPYNEKWVWFGRQRWNLKSAGNAKRSIDLGTFTHSATDRFQCGTIKIEAIELLLRVNPQQFASRKDVFIYWHVA